MLRRNGMTVLVLSITLGVLGCAQAWSETLSFSESLTQGGAAILNSIPKPLASTPLGPEVRSALDALIGPLIAQKKTVGAAVGLISQKGTQVFGYGGTALE